MTPRGAHAHDIIAKKRGRVVEARVKTKTRDAHIFRWNKRNGRVLAQAESPGTRLLHSGGHQPAAESERDTFRPRFYVAPTADVERKLDENFALWVSTPGKNGPQRAAGSPMVAIDTRTDWAWLQERCGKWLVLEGRIG